MKRTGIITALVAVMSLSVSPCHAHPADSTETQIVSQSVTEEKPSSTQNYWHDTTALPGQSINIAFQGDENFGKLSVSVAQPFSNFRVRVEEDLSLTVFVPAQFPGASTVSPVFKVSDHNGELDSFSIDVAYPRAIHTEKKRTNPFYQLVSDLIFRLPEIPFLSRLLEK